MMREYILCISAITKEILSFLIGKITPLIIIEAAKRIPKYNLVMFGI